MLYISTLSGIDSILILLHFLKYFTLILLQNVNCLKIFCVYNPCKIKESKNILCET